MNQSLIGQFKQSWLRIPNPVLEAYKELRIVNFSRLDDSQKIVKENRASFSKIGQNRKRAILKHVRCQEHCQSLS